MKYCLLLLIPAIFLFSCEGDVRFTTEQPNNMPALTTIPSSLQGNYVSNNDSLYVRANSMELVCPSITNISISDTASVGAYKTKSGKYLFHAGTNRYISRETKDSLTVVTRNAQLYNLGKDTVLKNFNDEYWLSMRSDPKKSEWKVMQISLHKQKLIIAVPSLPKDELKKMQQRMDDGKCSIDSTGIFSCVTPFTLSTDQTYYIVNASPDNLKKLDRRGLFRPVTTFDKVK